MENTQRWLSLTGICTTLGIGHEHAKWMAKQGFLTVMWGDRRKTFTQARYLDPTPEYAAKLKLGEALYGRLHPIPYDLDMKAMLTTREVAEIMGWTMKYAKQYLWKKDVPSVKVGQHQLYSILTVRKLLWKRNGRSASLSKQKSPFLIRELIEFFLKTTAADEQEVPTDAQFAEDELMQRKLTRMAKLKSPERELAMKQFMDKMELAKSLVSSR
jgi:hypothetical protein